MWWWWWCAVAEEGGEGFIYLVAERGGARGADARRGMAVNPIIGVQ